jgi:hypothetical protein
MQRGHTERSHNLHRHQAEIQPPHVINLADYQVRRKAILDGLTSEYQITA